jgi:hypothetical protein
MSKLKDLERIKSAGLAPSSTRSSSMAGSLPGACGIFDWTLFDNSNRRKVVRRPAKVGMFDLNLVWFLLFKQNIFQT